MRFEPDEVVKAYKNSLGIAENYVSIFKTGKVCFWFSFVIWYNLHTHYLSYYIVINTPNKKQFRYWIGQLRQ